MNANTKYFGAISYEQQDLLFMPEGLYGFETFQNFLLIHFHPENGNLLCLQSLDDPDLAFVLMNPFSVSPAYAPKLSKEDMDALGLSQDSQVTFYSLCVVREPLEESTLNLKCPITINPVTRQAKQVILEDSSYGYKYPLGRQNLA